ncbi:universal stress protein [Natrialbaceae archaeon A-arb3/5]
MSVLVPIDDSEPAMDAVEHAADAFAGDDVVLLHVISPNMSAYGEGASYAYDDIIDTRREAAQELFDEATEIATARGCTVETETVVGQPAREIVAFADDSGIDHIVTGSHGRAGASRVLLGSVAEAVVRRAPVPVTVVR